MARKPSPFRAPKAPANLIEHASVLVLKEKQGDRYIRIDNDADLFVAFRKVILDRLKDGWWYEAPEDIAAAKNAANGSGAEAYRFCDGRSRHEYEGFVIDPLEFAG